MRRERNSASGFGFVFLAGAIVGLVIGILFAPRSGTETRERIKEQTESAIDRVKEKLADLRKNATQDKVTTREEK